MTRTFDLGIVIPLYNKEETVHRAVEALLRQTVRPSQIVVVNDGSTDASVARLGSLADKITLLHQANAGPSAARNAGIAALRTEWVAIADADNVWDGQRVERVRDFFATHPGVDWAAGQYRAHLAGGRRELRPAWRATDAVVPYFESADTTSGLHCSETLVARWDLLREAGGFHPRLRCYEITLMYVSLALRRPRMGFIGSPTVDVYFDTPSSLYGARARHTAGLFVYMEELRLLQRRFAPAPPFVDHLIAEAAEECLYFAQERRDHAEMRQILGTYGRWLTTSLRWKTRLRCGLARLAPAG